MGLATLFPRLAALFREPAAEPGPVCLNARRIYILPTRHGLLFGIFLLAMLAGSINYGLSLGFAFVFLLAGVGLAAMLHTFRNLHGLVISPLGATPAFAGGQVAFHLRLAAPTPRPGLRLEAPGGPPLSADVKDSTAVTLRLAASRRGRFALPPVTVSTRHPLGLFRAWACVRPELATVVWPRPAEAASPFHPAPGEGCGAHAEGEGREDFQGLRPWVAGDAPRQVAWKAVARGGPLLSKRFADRTGGERWLSWDEVPGDVENRLSRLARGVLDAEAAGVRYGLRLPDRLLPPDRGPAHRKACLTALGLYGGSEAHE